MPPRRIPPSAIPLPPPPSASSSAIPSPPPSSVPSSPASSSSANLARPSPAPTNPIPLILPSPQASSVPPSSAPPLANQLLRELNRDFSAISRSRGNSQTGSTRLALERVQDIDALRALLQEFFQPVKDQLALLPQLNNQVKQLIKDVNELKDTCAPVTLTPLEQKFATAELQKHYIEAFDLDDGIIQEAQNALRDKVAPERLFSDVFQSFARTTFNNWRGEEDRTINAKRDGISKADFIARVKGFYKKKMGSDFYIKGLSEQLQIRASLLAYFHSQKTHKNDHVWPKVRVAWKCWLAEDKERVRAGYFSAENVDDDKENENDE